MKIKFNILFFFLISFLYFAQSISGKIIGEDGEAISYVEIIVKKASIKKVTISDEKGNFSLKVPEKGNYILEILDNGIKVFINNFYINGDTKESIRLTKFNDIVIQEVVVSKKIVQQIGDKTYFNVENSVLSKGNNGLDILQKSPKLSINSEGIVLLKNRAATILVNGRKINLSGNDLNNYLSGLSSEDIKRIEIQDVGSVDQDASSIGGVINIILKNNPKGFRSINKMSYAFRKEKSTQYNSGLNLNYGNEKWNLYSDTSYTENQNYGKSTGTFNYNNGQKNINNGDSKFSNNNLGLRLGSVFYPNNKSSFGIEGYYNKNKTVLNGTQNLEIYNGNSQTVNSKGSSLFKTPSDLWYITMNYTLKVDSLGSSLKFISDIGRNNTQPFNDVYSEYPSNSILNNHYLYKTNSVSNYYTGQFDWDQKFRNKWDLNAGVKYGSIRRGNLLKVNYLESGYWKEDFNQKQDFNNREDILAGYISVSKIFGRHFIKTGIRIENTNIKGYNNLNNEELKQNYTKLFPSLYYKYDLKNEKSLSFSYKRSITRPSFRDLNPFVIKQNDFLYIIGNPNLQPLYLDQIEIGYNMKKHSFSVYGRKTINTILGVYFTDKELINFYQPQNFGQYYEIGLDHSYNGNITKWLIANISSGIYYNSFKANDNGKNSGASFYNNIYAQVKYSKTLLLELASNYYHQYQYANVTGASRYRMDVSMRKSLINGNLLVLFKVTDIFNTERDKNISYYKDFDFNFYQKWQTKGFFLSVQYTLDNKNKLKSGTVKSDNDNRERL
ncbi:outer membrane beta-barrel family protein [Elizabethkingia sp. HX WHF]|uniref:outer membrane beta-barrel family protein n=1 Tax=Elizabethkingia TaxID=308865 RepID=UPI00099B170F|nr:MULTISPECIES: outer membrane beta-barrel family protein [Elizabethkingia]ATL43496.1 TonB-dependent receptor [Elizabethkingia miricola]MCL1638414.1 TonB-dependent receptor family protein [Elizabethkingia bruuniana]MDX8564558.1 outer membrane beta-barrel family protein [Elizabethkingia sp. HX WHF]OPC26339.1 hypothetical protein BAY00_03275 [Elizabethkingia bruuniana]